jgi:hypothetical protein
MNNLAFKFCVLAVSVVTEVKALQLQKKGPDNISLNEEKSRLNKEEKSTQKYLQLGRRKHQAFLLEGQDDKSEATFYNNDDNTKEEKKGQKEGNKKKVCSESVPPMKKKNGSFLKRCGDRHRDIFSILQLWSLMTILSVLNFFWLLAFQGVSMKKLMGPLLMFMALPVIVWCFTNSKNFRKQDCGIISLLVTVKWRSMCLAVPLYFVYFCVCFALL